MATGNARRVVKHRRQALLSLASFALIWVSGLGCSNYELETGYRYRPLNSSTIERRAFYADPYSIEAQQAQQLQEQEWSPRGLDRQRR